MGTVVTLSDAKEARGWSSEEEKLLRLREAAMQALGLEAALDLGKAEDGAAWAVEAIGEVIVRSYSKERGRIGVLDAHRVSELLSSRSRAVRRLLWLTLRGTRDRVQSETVPTFPVLI